MDPTIRGYLINKENHRRHALLKAIGSSESPAAAATFVVPNKLSFAVPVLATKKRRKVVRVSGVGRCFIAGGLKIVGVSCRGVWGHSPPGNFEILAALYINIGAIWGTR